MADFLSTLGTEIMSVGAAVVDRLPDNFSADVFKALIGSFFGAGLAFIFALRKDASTRLTEQRAAGNLAVTTLARMTNDFMQVSAVLADHRKRVLADQPQSPLWLQFKPMAHEYNEDLRFDIAGLTFIFDHPDGPEVFNILITAEIKFHSFFQHVTRHAAITEDAQDVLAASHPDPRVPRPVSELNQSLGFARIARIESIASAIIEHIDRSEPSFLEAGQALPALLKKLFKKGVIRFQPPDAAELKQFVEANR